jgi:hypothetical protein
MAVRPSSKVVEPASTLTDRLWRHYKQRLSVIEQASRRAPRHPAGGRVYLSEATGCGRKATLRLLRFQATPFSGQSNANIARGLHDEEIIALIYEAHGYRVTRQAPVITPYGNGKIDVLVQERQREGTSIAPVIVEAKSATSEQQRWLPREHHVAQALLYLGFYVPEGGDIVHPTAVAHQLGYTAEVAYYLNDIEQVIAYAVEWDPEAFAHLERALAKIDTAHRAGVPLPVPGNYADNKPPCEFPNTGRCQYWEHCWGTRAVTPEQADPDAEQLQAF